MSLYPVFQSLFYWNGLLRQGGLSRIAEPLGVSILVLLEWSSEADYGLYSRKTYRLVSILVLLEWSSEVLLPETAPSLSTMFQSLFYWNGLLRSKPRLQFAPSLHVSILVLLEWSSEVKKALSAATASS